MRKEEGFTLIEMMVVIAIIGILSAIAIPAFQRNDPKIRDAAGMIQADFERARSLAIRENAFVPIVLKNDGTGYVIFIDNGEGGGTEDNWVRDGGERLLTDTRLPNGVKIETDAAKTTFKDMRTRFDGRGYSTNSGKLTLSPLLSSNKELRVDMNNRFGRLRIKEEAEAVTPES